MSLLLPKIAFVAGAGPVGLTAAVELARRGLSVRIVDPDMEVSPQSRALAVNARTLELLEPSGVTEKLIAAGRRIRKIVIRRNSRVLGSLDIGKMPHRFNFLLSLPQSETERILEDHLAQQGIKVERGVALKSFAAGRRIDVTLSNDKETHADILIGADGSHSLVRGKLGFAFDGETSPQSFGLADVELDDWPFPFDTAVLTIMDTHLAPFIPMGDGHGRFVSTVPDCLNKLPPDAKVRRCIWETDFRVSYRQVSRYQDDNVFLAGDAAHIHSPAGGRGMNLGIEDACWLAWLLETGQADQYSALRHPVGAQVLQYTHSFTRFAQSRGSMQTLGIFFALYALNLIPPLRNRMFTMLSGHDTPAPPWLA